MMDLAKLKDPFPAEDIEWRVQSSGVKNGKPWALVLAYVTNRAIMDRLDEVCGPENWQNKFCPAPIDGVLCGISIKCEGGWITKWDGADKTDIEAVKGGLSGAMKRAGSQWGIGRYLYNLPTGWANIHENGSHRDRVKVPDGKDVWVKWDPPELPAWALPKNSPRPTKPPETPQDAPQAPESDVPDFTAQQIVGALKKQLGVKMKQSGIATAEEQKSFYLYCTDGLTESVDVVQNIIDRYDEYLEKYKEME